MSRPDQPGGEPDKVIDLAPHEWRASDKPPVPKPRYPRKTWFGLTDYGPPPYTWSTFWTQFLTAAALVIGLRIFGR